MAKIFLTGSGATKGFVTGSGFLNNPPRIMLREDDNLSGRYPTLHRLNRKGTEGIKQNSYFSDSYTVRYGTGIVDNFELKNPDPKQFRQPVDSSQWVVATPHIKIVREIFRDEVPEEVKRGVVVLSGPGDAEGRWLRTKNAVSKPTLTFSIIQGPYSTEVDESNAGSVRLFSGPTTNTLAVQASTTGTAGSWRTIKMQTDFIESVVSSDIINAAGEFTLQPTSAFLNTALVGDQLVQVATTSQRTVRPILRVTVDMHVFSDAGYKDAFYIRFIQTNFFRNKPNWGISNVKIVSRDSQKVRYPFLETNDTATIFHRNKKIATPNIVNGIVTEAAAVINISDTEEQPFDEQRNEPFLDNSAYTANNSAFLTQGVSANVFPGFNNKLFSKTYFDVSLSATDINHLTIGLQNPTPVSKAASKSALAEATRDNGQMLMAYWNFDLNRWQKIGNPLLDNRGDRGANPTERKENAEIRSRDFISGSCLGFGPIMPLTFGKGSTDQQLYDREVFDHYSRPISTFGFPFAAKYHATGSQTIKASSLGITKPMLLEKCIYDLNLDFVVPGDQGSSGAGSNNPNGRYAYNAYIHDQTIGLYRAIQRLKIYSPTFFILVQRPNNRSIDRVRLTPGITNYTRQIGKSPIVPAITEELPKTVRLVSGSTTETVVYDTRELVTYGQYQLFVTASKTTKTADAPPAVPHDAFVSSSIGIDDILDGGFSREAFDIVEVDDSKETNVIKITGKKMNVPVKITNKHEDVLRLRAFDNAGGVAANVGDFVFPILTNKMQSREFLFDGASRAIVNGFTSLRKTNKTAKFTAPNGGGDYTVPLNEDIEHISPYIIFPEDEIIFGLQYPVSWDLTQGPGGIDTSGPVANMDTDFNEMKVGNTKIRLVGSQIKNNVEFHEGLNQNLTTNAVHEVIGNEPVVDTLQIANRTELSGSFLDRFPFDFKVATPGSGEAGARLFGAYIHQSDPKVGNKLKDTEFLKTQVPSYRVTPGNNLVKSIISEEFSAATNPFLSQINKFFAMSDFQRIFFDARIVNAPGSANALQETAVGSYASMQNFTADGNALRKGGSPKYYFNYRHFGHFSDMIRQGLDSAFVKPSDGTNLAVQPAAYSGDNILPTANSSIQPLEKADGFNLPAVRARFVAEEESEMLSLRQFVEVRPSDVDRTSYRTFQSSNISPFATSSLPFFDNETVINRTYLGLESLEIISGPTT